MASLPMTFSTHTTHTCMHTHAYTNAYIDACNIQDRVFEPHAYTHARTHIHIYIRSPANDAFCAHNSDPQLQREGRTAAEVEAALRNGSEVWPRRALVSRGGDPQRATWLALTPSTQPTAAFTSTPAAATAAPATPTPAIVATTATPAPATPAPAIHAPAIFAAHAVVTTDETAAGTPVVTATLAMPAGTHVHMHTCMHACIHVHYIHAPLIAAILVMPDPVAAVGAGGASVDVSGSTVVMGTVAAAATTTSTTPETTAMAVGPATSAATPTPTGSSVDEPQTT